MASKRLNSLVLIGFCLFAPVMGQNANAQGFSFESSFEYREALSQLAKDLRRELNVDVDEINDQKLLKLMRESNVNNCIMKMWGKQMQAAKSKYERKQIATKLTKDLSQRIELVDNYLKDFGGSASQRLALAKRIARDADSTVDVMRTVLPQIDKYLGNGKGSFSDGLKMVETFYDGAFQSICDKLAQQQQPQGQYQSSRPNWNASSGPSILEPSQRKAYPGPQPVRVPSAAEADSKIPNMVTQARIKIARGQIVSARVVQNESHLCPYAQFIQKCYEFRAVVSESNRPYLYHGNLYADCSGYIMVEHPKK